MKAVIVNNSDPTTVTTVEDSGLVQALVALPEESVMVYGDLSMSPEFGGVPYNRLVRVRRKRLDLVRGEVRLLVEDYEQQQ